MLCLLFLAGITPQLEKSIFKIQLRNKINKEFYSVYFTIVNKCHILVLFSEKPKCFHQNVYNTDTSK